MIHVFIAGPYDDAAPLHVREHRVRAAMHAWHELQERGFWPYCPHLSHYLGEFKPKPREVWLAHSLEAMEKCDCVYRLPGESAGSDAEVARAQSLGKPIFLSVSALCGFYAISASETYGTSQIQT